MNPHPKPPSRKAEKQQAAKLLADYRHQQAEMAIERDGGMCQICASKGVVRQATDVHHVFGRGYAGSRREDHTGLMCVCRECHPAPLYNHDWGSDHEIMKLARKINDIRRPTDDTQR